MNEGEGKTLLEVLTSLPAAQMAAQPDEPDQPRLRTENIPIVILREITVLCREPRVNLTQTTRSAQRRLATEQHFMDSLPARTPHRASHSENPRLLGGVI